MTAFWLAEEYVPAPTGPGAVGGPEPGRGRGERRRRRREAALGRADAGTPGDVDAPDQQPVGEMYDEGGLPRDALSRAASTVAGRGSLVVGAGIGVEKLSAAGRERYRVIGGGTHDGPLSAVTQAFTLAGRRRAAGTPGGATRIEDPAVSARLHELDSLVADNERTIERLTRQAARRRAAPDRPSRWASPTAAVDEESWEQRRIADLRGEIASYRRERDALISGKLREAVRLQGNRARKGDADYRSPLPTPGHGLPKTPRPRVPRAKAAPRPAGDFNALHPRGTGAVGGQFIKKQGGAAVTAQERHAVRRGLGGPISAETIRAFQKRHGLQVDGVVGEQTGLALRGRFHRARLTRPGALTAASASALVARHARTGSRRTRVRRAGGGVIVRAEEDPEEGFWLDGLEEAIIEHHAWLESLHPRDAHGQFIEKIGGVGVGVKVMLDGKTAISRDKDGTWRVVRSGAIVKGFRSPEDAARAALDKSVKSTDAGSVGGSTSHKDFNAYLKARGVGATTGISSPGVFFFGGKKIDNSFDATAALGGLRARLKMARESEDQYVRKTVPTLEAREKELAEKVKAAGYDAKVGSSFLSGAPGTAPGVASAGDSASVTDGLQGPVSGGLEYAGAHVGKLPVGTVVKVKQSTTGGYTNQTTFTHLGGDNWAKNGDENASSHLGAAGYTVRVQGAPDQPAAASAAEVNALSDTLAASSVGQTVQHVNGTALKYVGEAGVTKYQVKLKGADYGTTQEYGTSVAAAKALASGKHPAKATPAKTKKFGKNEKQPNLQKPHPTLPGETVRVPLKELDLAPGDRVQFKTGGHIYEFQGQVGLHMSFKGPTGAQKSWAGYAKPVSVIKADGSALKLKAGDAATPSVSSPVSSPVAPAVPAAAPAAAPGPALSVEGIAGKLVPGSSGTTLGSLPEGTVVQSPDGKIGVLKPSEEAYAGYVSAYDIKTGQKFEVPASKAPHKYSPAPEVKKAAADQLKKLEAKTSVTAAVGVASAPAQSVGPPAEFHGAASWAKAVPHIPKTSHLPQEIRSAIASYTGSGYGAINAALRDSTGVKDMATAKKAALIKKAFHLTPPVEKDVWIGRRTNNEAWKAAAKAGAVITDNGAISCSTDQGTWSGNIHLNILARKGAHGLLNVKSISKHSSEDEVLLAPGSLFHVLKREEKGATTVLYVELLS